MIKQLIISIECSKVVSIYCDDKRTDTHLSGFIVERSENAVIVNHVSPDGYYDGFILVHMDDVFRVDLSGDYERKIQTLYTRRAQSHPVLPQEKSPYDSLLRYAREANLVISVELSDCLLSGLLLNYNNDYVQLKLLDDYGRENGESFIACSSIYSFAVDTTREQNILTLYHERNRGA